MSILYILLVFVAQAEICHKVELGPNCLYKSEICIGASRDWIENYTCVYKNAIEEFPYSIINEKYLEFEHQKVNVKIDRTIVLQFDGDDRLVAYRVSFLSFGSGYIPRDIFMRKLLEQIGYKQLHHYTHIDQSTADQYVGKYDFDKTTVVFEVPKEGVEVVTITVSKK